jgi:muramoyltetrapeptide carboxypeptidase LdcA involved in peptidoglycan recycling
MRKPRALVEGDRIAIVAPASPFDRGEFERGVEEIRRLGFRRSTTSPVRAPFLRRRAG